MLHHKNLVVAIKVDGKVLRESENTVYLPFGSEYSILFKNLSHTRVKVWPSIDGKSIFGDSSEALILNPRESIEVERFVTQLDVGNRFKFIERTAAVEEGRGITAEDGLVTVDFDFEVYSGYSLPAYSLFRSYASASVHPQGVIYDSNPMPTANSAGITAPGSISTQQFIRVPDFVTENAKKTITLQLLGTTATGVEVAKPKVVAVERCSICKTKAKARAKFCAECGSSLELI